MTQRKFIDFWTWIKNRKKNGINNDSIIEDIMAVFKGKKFYTKVGTELRLVGFNSDRLLFDATNGVSKRDFSHEMTIDTILHGVLYAKTISIEEIQFKQYNRRKLCF